MFMVKQEEIYTKPLDRVKCEFEKESCYEEPLLKIDRTVDCKCVEFFEPSDEEIVRYLKTL